MKITLIQKPTDLISTIYTACKTCYSGNTIYEIYENSKNVEKEKKLSLIKKVIRSEHFSVLEHCYFTFGIDGVSRSCTHQLVRHRLMSYSQQSLRYVEIKEDIDKLNDILLDLERLLLSGEIDDKELEKAKKVYDKYFYLSKEYDKVDKKIIAQKTSTTLSCLKEYLVELKNGIKPENAREILPMCIKSNIVVSCNLRALIEMSKKRLCLQAQEEIREMTEEMRNLIVKEYPFLAEFIVPNCENCKDFRECARKVNK